MNEIAIKDWIKNKAGYIIPIGDVHLGDESFTRKSHSVLYGNIKWIKDNPNSRVIIMGDLFNTATRNSKTNPFHSGGLKDEVRRAIDLFRPIKDQIIGAIDGNHEARATDFMDYSPLIHFCDVLGVRYMQYSGVFKVGVGVGVRKQNKLASSKPTPRITYIVYAHHTTGGGTTKGGRINRVAKLTNIVVDADLYLGAHNHDLVSTPNDGFKVDRRSGKVTRFRQYLVCCGGYLDWNNSYAEAKMYPPLKLGSPKIRLDGIERDIKVSL